MTNKSLVASVEKIEFAILKSQIVTSGWGGVRTAPYTA